MSNFFANIIKKLFPKKIFIIRMITEHDESNKTETYFTGTDTKPDINSAKTFKSMKESMKFLQAHDTLFDSIFEIHHDFGLRTIQICYLTNGENPQSVASILWNVCEAPDGKENL